MKIDVMSDLHFDLLPYSAVKVFFLKYAEHVRTHGAPDLLLLAGDIGSFTDVRQRAEWVDQFQALIGDGWVLDIAGNHEFWHSDVRPQDVGPKTTTANGAEVLMGTGWVEADELSYMDTRYWPDFKYVCGDSMEAAHSIHRAHQDFCEALELSKADIVMAHHFPLESIAEEWRGSDTNIFFASPNFAKALQMAPKLPKLFVHGHTHVPVDYVHPLGFRVYCNPLGYNAEGANKDFWNRIRIELA